MLVDRIVTTYWRLHRVVIAEAGEIALSVDGGNQWRTQTEMAMLKIASATTSPLCDAARKMEESTLGVAVLCSMLESVRATVEKNGQLTDEALQETYIAGKATSLTDRFIKLRAFVIENAEGSDEAAIKINRRKELLSTIDWYMKQYEMKKHAAREREEAEESARQAAEVLPSADTLDKILRYETTLERQMYRAMHQLERLQRLRQGEAVPPPLSMEFSAR